MTPEHIDDAMEELMTTIRMATQVYFHYEALRERGVKWIDPESYEPVIPDNILMFPANRRIQ